MRRNLRKELFSLLMFTYLILDLKNVKEPQ